MLGSLKRRKVLRGRAEAAPERIQAAKDLVAAFRAAEEALSEMKAANDKFYRSEQQAEQASLSALRRDRERLFAFFTSADILAEAPHLARVLGLRIAGGRQMPLVAWIEHTTKLDLAETE